MAYPKIKIRALQAFLAVYEEQSFSRAAERENTTQSGMSTQVKGLELILGAPLLRRDRNKFTLTPPGEIIYRQGQSILKALLDTEKMVREIEGQVTGLVRFGMIPSLTRSALIPALQSFTTDFPDVELSLVEEYSFSLMRRVLDEELDFALVPSTELPNGLKGTFVGHDREILVSSAAIASGYEHLEAITLEALNGARLIVPSKLNVRRKHLDTLLNSHGIHLKERLEMDGMLATLEMVGATDWVAVLPSAICHSDKNGSTRKLNPIKNPPIGLDYILVERAASAQKHAAQLLAKCLINHINEILLDWEGPFSIQK